MSLTFRKLDTPLDCDRSTSYSLGARRATGLTPGPMTKRADIRQRLEVRLYTRSFVEWPNLLGRHGLIPWRRPSRMTGKTQECPKALRAAPNKGFTGRDVCGEFVRL